jgi:uncharacterized protein YkwD
MVKVKTVRKSKTTAVILAILFGPFSWLYTYRQDKIKIWISAPLFIITLSLWYWVAWLWAFIDSIRRPNLFYKKAGVSFTEKQRKVLWVLAVVAVLLVGSLFTSVAIIAHNNQVKQQRIAMVEAARLAADPITDSDIFTSVNKLRASSGAGAQSLEPNLSTAAEQKCNDMVKNNYFNYKNPKTGKQANDYIKANLGDLYVGYYVAVLMSGDSKVQTATDVVTAAAKENTNITDPKYNVTGWAVCSPDGSNALLYVVGMNAEKKERPVAPVTRYVPTPSYTQPTYTAPTHCYTTYNDYGGYFNPTASTDCY